MYTRDSFVFKEYKLLMIKVMDEKEINIESEKRNFVLLKSPFEGNANLLLLF